MRDELAAMKFGLVDQLALKPASIKTLLPSHIDSKLLSGVSKQAAALTSSDESDATLNESINKSDALPAQGNIIIIFYSSFFKDFFFGFCPFLSCYIIKFNLK